jgi:histidine kinase/DNA gyrase B/HSP90-like ATPase
MSIKSSADLDDLPKLPADLHAQLATASWEAPKPFAETLVRTLAERLGLAAASLWLYTDEQKPLRLRADIGMTTSAYESFELDLAAYPGQAVLQDDVLSLEPSDLLDSPYYRDKGILPADAKCGMVTGPLKVPDRSPDGREHVGVSGAIGALCLYPRKADERTLLRDWLLQNSEFLGRLYVATLERYAMDMRRLIVDRVAFRKDLSSLEHNFLLLACAELSVEAAQLWVVDPAHKLVYLHRKIGSDRRPIHDILPLAEDDTSPVMRCFASGQTLIHSSSRPLDGAAELAGGLEGEISNAMLVPLPLPSAAKLRARSVKSAGVLVLLNHFAKLEDSNGGGTIKHLTTATWEDRFIARFSCQMLAVLMFQMLKSRDYESDFERLMHGARSSLHGPLQNLLELPTETIDSVLPEQQRNYVSDAIFWLEDLMAQINRNELIGRESLDLGPVHLYHDVLTKIGSMARRMPPPPPTKRPVVTGLESSRRQRTVPRVRGNEAALTCVFRNLVDNSVKYAVRSEGFVPEVRFTVDHSPDSSRVIVTISDNGIGIPPADRTMIFEDRFRGALARAHEPAGVGRGLHDCRTLLRRMHGEIVLLDTPPGETGTRFQVSLPVADERGAHG